MALRKGIVSGLNDLVTETVTRGFARFDADDQELPQELQDILAALGISITTVLNDKRLRKRLRVLANHITQQKLVQLTQVLGTLVMPPSSETINVWVDEQAKIIAAEVEALLLQVDEDVRKGLKAGKPLAKVRSEIEQKSKATGLLAVAAASTAVLALNATVTQEMAQKSGSTHYRWIATQDSKTRAWHQALHNTIQSWDKPPMGGACSASYKGHPGECPTCRCQAIPIAGEYVAPKNVQITLQAGDTTEQL